MKKFGVFIGVLLVLSGVVYAFIQTTQVVFLPDENPQGPPYYRGVNPIVSKVTVFSENVPQVTQIEITPDGNYMIVGKLPGEVIVYQKKDGHWRRQATPFFRVETSQPGFPPEEAGLTGIILGADFEKSGDVFFSYSFAKEKKSFSNRMMRVTFTKVGKNVFGRNPILIFEANTPGTGSHQIQDGVGVMINNKPHVLYTVGEGYVGERALNPKLEAGKVMLIQRDGSVSQGIRPFPQSPKVQALGIRNAPAIALNTKNGKIAIGDTGPNNYDRFLYGRLIMTDGSNNQKLSLNWDGSEESLQKPAKDLYSDTPQDMVLYRWAPTETAVNIVFYENEKLPNIPENQQYVIVSLFGRTGDKSNTPGKKIILGILTHGEQNKLELQNFVERTEDGDGKLAHPLGLAVDPQSKDVYFGDILEGRIYKIETGGDKSE